MHQFLMRGSELAYNDDPDNSNKELTREELDTLEEHRRADGALGHTVLDSDDLENVHLGRAGFVEDGINHHVHGYSVKETAFEQNTASVGGTEGDENTVTGTGHLKQGIQDDSSARAERAKNRRAFRQVTEQERLRQELAALNARIGRLEKQKAQADSNVEKLKEAREILADDELNADTERGRILRERLKSIDSGLRGQGVDIGVQVGPDGKIANADAARNNAARSQSEQEAESERLGRELDDARQERDEFLERHPDMRDERSAHFDVIAQNRTAVETVEFDARVAEINLEADTSARADMQRMLARTQPDSATIQTANLVSSADSLNSPNQVSSETNLLSVNAIETLASLDDNMPPSDDIGLMTSLDGGLPSDDLGDMTIMASLDDSMPPSDNIGLMTSLDSGLPSDDLGDMTIMASLDMDGTEQTISPATYTLDETIGSFAANGEESVITQKFNPISSGEVVQIAEANISSPDLENASGSPHDNQQNDQNSRLPIAAMA